MKYEPKGKPPATETEALMMPFFDGPIGDPEHDEMVDLVMAEIMLLPDGDKQCLLGSFYDRFTYEELATRIGVKAKSHAWSRTQKALALLKERLLENPRFVELANEHYRQTL